MTRRSAILLPDSGPDVGMGHAGRCAALGEALAAAGWRVLVVADDAAARRHARSRGLRTATKVTGRWDVAVVDSYRRPAATARRLRSAARKIAAIDDLHQLTVKDVDLIVRPSIGERAAAGVLGGGEYVLLRRDYWTRPPRREHARVTRVLVSLGAYPRARDLERLERTAREALPGAAIAVGRGVVRGTLAGLREGLLAADAAVVSGGQTLNEALSVGTPVLAVTTFPNQRRQIGAAARAGAIVSLGELGSRGITERVARELRRLDREPASRRALARSGRRLVDGRGAKRVASTLAQLAARRS